MMDILDEERRIHEDLVPVYEGHVKLLYDGHHPWRAQNSYWYSGIYEGPVAFIR